MKVISLGGSLIIPDNYNISYLNSLKKSLLKSKEQFIIVCGGGMLARRCQQYAKLKGVKSKSKLDWIGIEATRQNAEVVKELFGNCHSKIISDPRTKVKTNKKFTIACGWKPGRSTDFDAVMLAKQNGAKEVINLSNVDYVYTKDPKLKGAKPIVNITWKEFNSMFSSKWNPGANVPFDPIASRLAKEEKIQVIITNGAIANLNKILLKKNYKGTTIN